MIGWLACLVRRRARESQPVIPASAYTPRPDKLFELTITFIDGVQTVRRARGAHRIDAADDYIKSIRMFDVGEAAYPRTSVLKITAEEIVK